MDKIIEPDRIQREFGSTITHLTLASSSPNRRRLLEEAGVRVRVYTPDIDESKVGKTHEEQILNIASRKLDAYLNSDAFRRDELALSADTLVLFKGELVGKLKTETAAFEFLKEMSGKKHEVLTACGIYIPGVGKSVFLDRADVIFKSLNDTEIASYISTDEWMGAAGAYRLQKTGYKLVERINGDWTTVVGLPLLKILSHFNSEALHSAQSLN